MKELRKPGKGFINQTVWSKYGLPLSVVIGLPFALAEGQMKERNVPDHFWIHCTFLKKRKKKKINDYKKKILAS